MTFNDYLATVVLFGTIWLFVAIFGCAIFSAVVASSKNRSAVLWFFAGLLFNLVGLIAIAGMSPAEHD